MRRLIVASAAAWLLWWVGSSLYYAHDLRKTQRALQFAQTLDDRYRQGYRNGYHSYKARWGL